LIPSDRHIKFELGVNWSFPLLRISPPQPDLKEPNMKTLSQSLAAVSVASALMLGTTFTHAAATADEATAMVKKGVAFVKANGADKGYAEISNQEGQFRKDDLYLTVYSLDGVVRAHGANQKMVGKNLLGLKDIDGKAFVQERMDLAKSKGSFWQDYKFTNPTTKTIQPKAMYCEKLDDFVVCGGVYKN
jgi:cytochrome c